MHIYYGSSIICLKFNCFYVCSFIGRLFRHALEDSRPKSVLVNSLSVCISLLDPKRLTLGVYHTYNRQITQGPTVTANPETVEGMLESLSKVPPLMLVFDFLVNLTLTFQLLPPFFFIFLLLLLFFISLGTITSKTYEYLFP